MVDLSVAGLCLVDLHLRLLPAEVSTPHVGSISVVGRLHTCAEDGRGCTPLMQRHNLIGLGHHILGTPNFKGQAIHRAGRGGDKGRHEVTIRVGGRQVNQPIAIVFSVPGATPIGQLLDVVYAVAVCVPFEGIRAMDVCLVIISATAAIRDRKADSL